MVEKKEVTIMAMTVVNNLSEISEKENVLRMLDRGIDDMENGRELPLEEAFQKIKELRDNRRNARL